VVWIWIAHSVKGFDNGGATSKRDYFIGFFDGSCEKK
jgi:hypothetical protein